MLLGKLTGCFLGGCYYRMEDIVIRFHCMSCSFHIFMVVISSGVCMILPRSIWSRSCMNFFCYLSQQGFFLFLQESIRNSADGSLLSAPESLIVSICNNHGVNSSEQHTMSTFPLTPRKSSAQSFGINGLELLKFSYKVCSTIIHFFDPYFPF